MKFGPVPVVEAEGKILGHHIAGPDGRRLFRKGRPLSAADLRALQRLGQKVIMSRSWNPEMWTTTLLRNQDKPVRTSGCGYGL